MIASYSSQENYPALTGPYFHSQFSQDFHHIQKLYSHEATHLYQTSTEPSSSSSTSSSSTSSSPSSPTITSNCSIDFSNMSCSIDLSSFYTIAPNHSSSSRSLADEQDLGLLSNPTNLEMFSNFVPSTTTTATSSTTSITPSFQFDPSITTNPFTPTGSFPQDSIACRDTMNAPSRAFESPSSSTPSVTSSPSASSSVVSSPVSTDYDELMMNSIIPVIACASCKRSHIKCDSGRPCTNCRKHPSKAATCRDAIPKPRGRPKGGSKAAAEAIYQARLHQRQQAQFQDQYHGHVPRPRVMSLPLQHRQQQTPSPLQHSLYPQSPSLYPPSYQQPSPHQQAHTYFYPRSSPASPAASEHRAARLGRRTSLPAQYHHPYAMSRPSRVSAPRPLPPYHHSSPSGYVTEVIHPLTPCFVSPTRQDIEVHHFLQQQDQMSQAQGYSSYPSMRMSPSIGQDDPHQLQMFQQNPCVYIKSESKDLGLMEIPAYSSAAAAASVSAGPCIEHDSIVTFPHYQHR